MVDFGYKNRGGREMSMYNVYISHLLLSLKYGRGIEKPIILKIIVSELKEE